MPQLAKTVVGKAKFVVRKTLIDIKRFLSGDSNFQFVLCPSIGDDFPVVDSIEKWSIGSESSEIIVSFVKESMPKIIRK